MEHLVNGPSAWPSEYDDDEEDKDVDVIDVETEYDRIAAERDLLYDERSY